MSYFKEWLDSEERENGKINFAQQLKERAIKSYEKCPDANKRYCSICGELLVARSISYYEGCHIDSCI